MIGDPAQKLALANANAAGLKALLPIDVGATGQFRAEVLGFSLYKRNNAGRDFSGSQFAIASPKVQGLGTPLVLPVEAGNKYAQLTYTDGQWGLEGKAPYVEPVAQLGKRLLPHDGSQYPYLAIGDLLEDTLVRVPFPVANGRDYYLGQQKLQQNDHAYLLPLRHAFFDYFNVDDLMKPLPGGVPMVKIEDGISNSATVTLRIPIKGNGSIRYVEYQRIYFSDKLQPDPARNAGNIAEFKVTGFILPAVKFANAADASYNVTCIQHTDADYAFAFYDADGKKITPKSETCRNQNLDGNMFILKGVNYVVEKANIAFIEVKGPNGSGIIVPRMMAQVNGSDVYEFAVDLGTSNTHIEYRLSGTVGSRPLDFTQENNLVCKMFKRQGVIADVENTLQNMEYVPDEVGKGACGFPLRTVLLTSKNINWNAQVEPLTLANVAFFYDKVVHQRYNDFQENIKWGDTDNSQRVLEMYVDCLMHLMRCKVLLQGGDLLQTKVTWFYPISMAPNRLTRLRSVWDAAYQKYFNPEGSTSSLTESVAPTHYYFNQYAAANHMVNIDIGGGTTDIAFTTNQRVDYVTSFQFATDALFADAYAAANTQNGIVDYYKTGIRDILGDLGDTTLSDVFDKKDGKSTASMASFLFALKDSSNLQQQKVNLRAVDFNLILQRDEHFKIVFILFYTSIIYHVAQIVRQQGLMPPRHIAFSGNGSKVVRIVTTDAKLLARYTKLIFENVTGKPYGGGLDILGIDGEVDPKEVTCKGGISAAEASADRDSIIVLQSDGNGLVTAADTYGSVTDAYKQATIKAVRDFLDFTLERMSKEFNFKENFGITQESLDIAREVSKNDLATFLDKGISKIGQEVTDDDVIKETFFFYPLKGVLPQISTHIYSLLRSNNN